MEANTRRDSESTSHTSHTNEMEGVGESTRTSLSSPPSSTCTDNNSTTTIAKEETFEELVLPAQRMKNDKTRQLRYVFFSLYRKMFAVIFAVNAIALIAFMAKNKGYPTLTNIKNATSANILACVMMRQENVVNFIYEVACCVPLSTPFSFGKKLAKVYHYGGVHSGCGVAAVVWFLLYTALTTRDFVREPTSGLPVGNVITCYLLITMYTFILIGAYPTFRVRFHDYFEMMHRFSGWSSFAILWAQTIILAQEQAQADSINIGLVLVKNPGFWFLLISTFFIGLSWGRLRHREVHAEVLSTHAARLHFSYKDMQPYYGLKVSDKPLTEWHAFATIPEPDGKGFSVVVSKAGDWTTKTINEPPKKLWTRGFPVHGPLYGARLFKQIVIVATGSGIGPCMSLFADDKIPRRILWSARDPLWTRCH